MSSPGRRRTRIWHPPTRLSSSAQSGGTVRPPRYPSYIPSRTFVAALTSKMSGLQEALAEVDEAGRDTARAEGEELERVRRRLDTASAKVEKMLTEIPNKDLS